jgi:AraC-like DNA-binding protein
MTDSSEDFAGPLGSAGFSRAPELDALSEILHTMRLQGSQAIRCAPPPPFHIVVPAELRVLHVAETDGLRLIVGERDIALRMGDMVLLASGRQHHAISAGDQSVPRKLTVDDVIQGAAAYDDAATPARWVTGIFSLANDRADPLLSVLPAAIVVTAEQPGLQWLPLGLKLLLTEITAPSPGSSVMISRLLDLLLIQSLRQWATTADANPGSLTAAMDVHIAPVLAAIHRKPEHPWTVRELADIANLSRSAFADRFSRLLGQTPAAYVAGRRLDRAAELLRSTTTPVTRISQAVGYNSESAFSRAFQRRFGQSPLRWRKVHTHNTSSAKLV